MVCLCPVGGRLSTDIEALLSKALEYYNQADYRNATAQYHQILGFSPHQPDALLMLGVLAQIAKKMDLALALFEQAIAARPRFPQALFNRSLILYMLGRKDEALRSAFQVIDADANIAEAWDFIGQILKDKGDLPQAAASFVKAISLQGNNPHFYGNYADALFAAGELGAACQAAYRAEMLDENYPPTILGNVLQALGYPEMAADRFARASKLRPDFKESASSEAMARLQMGDMGQGWTLWENRPDLSSEIMKDIPLWRGQKVDHLLLYEDQGLGDAIQFMRYIPLLKECARHISLRSPAALRRLYAENFPGIILLSDETQLPTDQSFDARCRLSSLPFFFGTRIDTIPTAPYLKASFDHRAKWQNFLDNTPLPRIGLTWAGNANFHNDAKRSLPTEMVHSLIVDFAPHIVLIQKNRTLEKERFSSQNILDAAPLLEDFADTAALISQLDLVIAVDTATAHLAGALGKPVFLLLPFASDWRWLLGRSDSPWYGTVQLFRQKKIGDWADVIQRVRRQADLLIAGDSGVLKIEAWQGENLRQNPDALSLPI